MANESILISLFTYMLIIVINRVLIIIASVRILLHCVIIFSKHNQSIYIYTIYIKMISYLSLYKYQSKRFNVEYFILNIIVNWLVVIKLNVLSWISAFILFTRKYQIIFQLYYFQYIDLNSCSYFSPEI